MKKKMLSLAAMLAVLSFASPAQAELKFSGDAAVRIRSQFGFNENASGFYDAAPDESKNDNLLFQYRVRLRASADMGSGYFFKAMLMSEEDINGAMLAGGWAGVGNGNAGAYNLEVSNFVFGRMMQDSHYMMGRLPLNAFNNPIFDLAMYPVPGTLNTSATGTAFVCAVDNPIVNWNMDRVFGLNYGTKIGKGELNTTLVVFDDAIKGDSPSEGDGLLNDGYALHIAYKTTLGSVTIEPQAVLALTNLSGLAYKQVSPYTFGMNMTIPVEKSKVGLSAFYTLADDTEYSGAGNVVDYNGVLLRAKFESGPFMAFVDYNHTNDNSPTAYADEYDNWFVWAQYSFKVYESAMGTFSVTPTVRYRASDNTYSEDHSMLRAELYATVTF
ncbi:MAG: hypothetical protein HGA77_04195 [Chlorobiaceae bacterium]|nr:hypothetical protein [Chlorobiaceae bacterium]